MPLGIESLIGVASALAYRAGITDYVRHRRRDVLTVLCYHRVVEPDPGLFQGFRPNISASPQAFAQQIAYLARNFTPISVGDLEAFLWQARPLPPDPVLVTFDDGYRDNGEVAWPILRRHGVPAVVFLATDHIGTRQPFLWDYAAWCFEATTRRTATLPLTGETPLGSRRERQAAIGAWMEAVKTRPDAEKWLHARQLAGALDSEPPQSAFDGLCLDWDEVRRLNAEGLEFGGHTMSHPILTKVPWHEAEAQIAGAGEDIADALGRFPRAFAYPNGTRADFAPEHEAMSAAAGYSLAFSLEPGPVPLRSLFHELRRIPRIYVGMDDDLPRFAAKLAGAARLRGAFGLRRQVALRPR